MFQLRHPTVSRCRRRACCCMRYLMVGEQNRTIGFLAFMSPEVRAIILHKLTRTVKNGISNARWLDGIRGHAWQEDCFSLSDWRSHPLHHPATRLFAFHLHLRFLHLLLFSIIELRPNEHHSAFIPGPAEVIYSPMRENRNVAPWPLRQI